MLSSKSIRGVNLGSWLLMEGYILGGANIAESNFKQRFIKTYGRNELEKFEYLFRDNFITENDFKKISSFGANAVRVPFNYRLIERKPYSYSEEGFSYLEKAFTWAQKYNLGVILDLHAASGSQNCDWHADSSGKALLWEDKDNQCRTIALWEAIVSRFKDRSSLIGYDVLNEPVLYQKPVTILKKFYQQLVNKIRKLDKKSIIILEGDDWAQRIDFLEDLIDDNTSISIHTYQPIDYTFNFSPFLKFPGKINGAIWNEARVRKHLEPYYEFSKRNKVKIFVGEFGINWRGGGFGEIRWLESILKAFNDFNFDYTYWTYKAIANNVFPDGICQSIENCKYINRQGPVSGWETYLDLWGKEKDNIVNFWRTDNFVVNKKITNTLGRFFKNDCSSTAY